MKSPLKFLKSISQFLRRIKRAYNDPNRKPLPGFLLVYARFKLFKPQLAEQYFNKYLYNKYIDNTEDYIITTKIMIQLWELNEKNYFSIMRNKLISEQYFSQVGLSFVKSLTHNVNSLFFSQGEMIQIKNPDDFINFLKKLNKDGLWKQNSMIVKKTEDSCQGKDIFKLKKEDLDNNKDKIRNLFHYVIQSKYLFQDLVIQHPDLNQINPNALNTLRIDTYTGKHGISRIFNVALRMSPNQSFLDSFPYGGMQVGVDIETGKLYKTAFVDFENGHAGMHTHHPLTSTMFEGFEIPFFQEAKDLALKAAQSLPEIKISGWDIGIQPEGPIIIEGNNCPGINFSEISQKGFKSNPIVNEMLSEAKIQIK